MSYKNEHMDYIFYRMKECLPKSGKFYYFIAILKLLPLFLQVHSMGYSTPTPNSSHTIHTYFKYLSMTFYIENSIDISNIITIAGIFLVINIFLILALIYYLTVAKKAQNDDENYGSQNSLDFLFSIFSNFAFFKYVILSQFFYEINFLPLTCINSKMDFNKMKINEIFNYIDEASYQNNCQNSNLIIFLIISVLNMIIDTTYNYVLISRFFDYNILSNFFWNCYPNLIYSFLFLESLAQVFFILFLNYENSFYKLTFSIYVYFLILIYLYRFISKNEFYSHRSRGVMKFLEVYKTIIIIAQIIVQAFDLSSNQSPNDFSIFGMIIFEFILAVLKYSFLHKNDTNLVSQIITSNLNRLNEKNIFSIFNYLITEFKNFSDVNHKFQDENLDLFLENYTQHLKLCEDYNCPCKNYIKKVSNATNTIKTDYHTVINFTHLGGNYQDEYILNKFFNVLSANVSTTIKYTNNNVNLNNIKDSNKQKIIYNLRVRLINAVKKLISYRLEYLFSNLDTLYTNNFSAMTKHFIRINYFSLLLICNKTYYKTIFQFHEFLSDFQKKHGKNYHSFFIYYFYLKKFGIKEYNQYISFLKSVKKESSIFNMDFRKVMSLCIKFYEIEEKLVANVKNYQNFISYFEKNLIEFNSLLHKVKKFKTGYKNLTKYIRHFFKNDKINNLFVCSKIILYYKILQFDIPESLHNKLIVQTIEDEGVKSNPYIDSNYYIIANYIEGEFVIKFVSHELLIILEYSEEELRDQDFHLLMPESMRQIHKQMTINEIKNKNNYNVQYKEIFFVSKKRSCILFDLHYKILLNLKGEITLLCVLNLIKPKNDFRSCFVCVDDSGEVLAMNREFEEYLIISMKMLDYVRIDTEKIILQNLGNRIRSFFKDEENYNSEFFEKFDYEYYLSSLFGEEFEQLRDKNETLYKKKFAKWESLREVIKKGRYYNRFIDIYVKMRKLSNNRIYFIKYLIKANLSVKSLEPYNTTISLINAVKVSKREMAKLSFFKMEEINEAKSEVTNEERINESQDFLNESQSILSSAANFLKNRNSKRLFRAKKNRFKFLPKTRNILILMIFLGSLSLISIVFNVISLYTKFNMLEETQKVMKMQLYFNLLKNSVFYLSSGIYSLALIEQNLIPQEILENNIKSNFEFKSYADNTIELVSYSIEQTKKIVYEINHLNNIFYDVNINNRLQSVNNNFKFLYNNGLIYKKGESILNENTNKNIQDKVITYYEISNFHKAANNFLNNFMTKSQKLNFKDFILFNKIDRIQNNLSTKIILSDDDIFLFYILNNLFTQFEPFLQQTEEALHNYKTEFEVSMKSTMTIIKVFEFIIVITIILIELVFIYLGYEKAKKKMINLKQKVKENNVNVTLKKIEEFIKFCNNFNIYSLYVISDFEIGQKKEILERNTSRSFHSEININNTPMSKKSLKIKDVNITETSFLKNSNNNLYKNGESENFNNYQGDKNQNKMNRFLKNEEKANINKSLLKLENMKKQRKQSAFYMKKDSQNSFKNVDNSEIDNFTSNIMSSDLINNLEVPNEKLENELNNMNTGNNFNNDENSIRNSNNNVSGNNTAINTASSFYLLNRENLISDQRLNIDNINSKESNLTNLNILIESKSDRNGSIINMDQNILIPVNEKMLNSDLNNLKDKNFESIFNNSTIIKNQETSSNRDTPNVNSSSNLNESKVTANKLKSVLRKEVILNDQNNFNLTDNEILIKSEQGPINSYYVNIVPVNITSADMIGNNPSRNFTNAISERYNTKNVQLNYTKSQSEKIEDSNAFLLTHQKTEETPIDLLKNSSMKSNKKIKWTEKNLKRFYSPDRVLQESENLNKNQKLQRKVDKLMAEGDHNNVEINFINQIKNLQDAPFSQYVNNTDINENMNDDNNESVAFNSKSERKHNKDSNNNFDMNDLREMDLKDYKRLNSTNLTTYKKKIEKENKLKNDDVEEYIETISHSNFTPKIILFTFGLIFFILYLVSVLLHLNSFNIISSLADTTDVLLEKVSYMNNLLLKYKFNIISNSTQEDLKPQFDLVYENMDEFIALKDNSFSNDFPNSYNVQKYINDKNACNYLSYIFSDKFNTTQEYEKNECLLIGGQINKNGLEEAHRNILNSMQQLNTDMLKLTDLSEESLIDKLKDLSYFNLVLDFDYTFRKYHLILSESTSIDTETYFVNFKMKEDIFSYSSIFLNVVFSLVSLIFIILPIKYVELVINWLISKLINK